MATPSTQHRNANWLLKSGSKELELLLRIVLYHSSQPVLIVDDDRHCLDASFGACKLLELLRDQVIARTLDELVAPSFQPQVEPLWHTFLEQGEQAGTLPLMASGGAAPEMAYVASGSVLPGRHLLVLHERVERKGSGESARGASATVLPCARTAPTPKQSRTTTMRLEDRVFSNPGARWAALAPRSLPEGVIGLR